MKKKISFYRLIVFGVAFLFAQNGFSQLTITPHAVELGQTVNAGVFQVKHNTDFPFTENAIYCIRLKKGVLEKYFLVTASSENMLFSPLAQVFGSTQSYEAGVYEAQIYLMAGCSTVVANTQTLAAFTIYNPMILTATVTENVSCFNGNNGEASLSITGGSNNTTTTWSSTASQSGGGLTASGLKAGTITFMVTDNETNMVKTATAMISQPSAALEATIAVTKNINCINTSGETKVTASGGTPPYSFLPTPNFIVGNEAFYTGLTAGTNYSATVMDANSCTAVTGVVQITSSTTTPGVSPTAPQQLDCSHPSVQIFANPSPPGGTFTFSWSGPGAITQPASQNPFVTVGGQYNLTVTNTQNGCTATASITVAASSDAPQITATASVLQFTCKTGETQSFLKGSSTTTGVTFKWTGPNGYMSTEANPLVAVTTPGSYMLVVTKTSSGCTSSAQFTIGQDIAPPTNFITTPPDGTSFCKGSSLSLSASAQPTTCTFVWKNPPPSQVITPGPTISADAGGLYSVTATRPDNGCSATKTINITEKPLPQMTAPLHDTLFKVSSSTSINFNWWTSNQFFATFEWKASKNNISSVIATSGTGEPVVGPFIVEDKSRIGQLVYQVRPVLNGCFGDSVSITINVLPDGLEVFVPEAFSPNGDGKNDDWVLTYPTDVKPEDYEVFIFNRSGGKVFGPQPLSQAWDGEGCPNGTYFYVISSKTGSSSVLKGAVTLLGKN